VTQHIKLIARYWFRGLLLLLALLALDSWAQADGGSVELHQVVGPFVVTVFTAPVPLRAGPVDISVLVQDRASGQPVLDGDVSVRLQGEGGMTLVEPATRAMAQNKLLYSALLTLPEAGKWELEVTIKQGKEAVSVPGHMSAALPRPFLLAYWRSLSVPPFAIAIFALNQWLKRRRVSLRQARDLPKEIDNMGSGRYTKNVDICWDERIRPEVHPGGP
jgi:hypothetical protein